MTGRPMAAICRALHVARATGYLRSRPRKGRFYRRAEDTEVLYQILSVTKTRASYGYRRTHRLVNRRAGGRRRDALQPQANPADHADRRPDASGEKEASLRPASYRQSRDARLQSALVLGRIQHPLLERRRRPRSPSPWTATTAKPSATWPALGTSAARTSAFCSTKPSGPDSASARSRLPSRSSGSRTTVAPTPRRTPSSTPSTLGFRPVTTPAYSPESNGMAEAFVNTIKRDYVQVPISPTAKPSFGSSPPGSTTTTESPPTPPSECFRPWSFVPSTLRLQLSRKSGSRAGPRR